MRTNQFLKHSFLLVLLIISNQILNAQSSKIKGYLFDNQTKAELPFATISATNVQSKEFFGVASDINGYYELNITPGTYNVVYTFTGYKSYTKNNVVVKNANSVVNIEKIYLTPDAQVFDGVEIQGEKETMKLEVDKKVFDVQNNPMTIGGTAVDVLNQIPTVDVDMDGNVSLRGSEDVQIYINGKPTNFSGADKQAILQQIPAANIERIEIINNPSAKFDAEGTAGIINIILKSSVKAGWNATATIGYGTFDRYNASASYSYGAKKLKLSTTYGFRDHNSISRGNMERLNKLIDTSYYLIQNSENNRGDLSHTWNGNIDYELTQKTTISFNWLGSISTRNNPEKVFYHFENSYLNPFYEYSRIGDNIQDGKNGEIGLGLTHNFDKAKQHNLIFISNLSASTNKRTSLFTQDEFGFYRQEQNTKRITDNFMPMAQLDYTRPMGESTVWETGLKFTMRDVGNDFYADTMNFNSKVNEIDNSLTNNFLYSEIVNAAYVTYSQSFDWFKVKAGVRAEQSIVSGNQVVGDTGFSKNYINFFPSIFLTREIKKGQDFQLSYSRRINRPWIHALNPFAEQTDPYNLRRGNPNLNPELIDAYEATYFVADKGNFISGTVYYRQVNGVFQRFRMVDEHGVATMTTTNLDVSRNAGLEGIIRRRFKDFNATLNMNFFRNQVSGNLMNTAAAATNYSWFGKLLMGYKVNKNIDASATYFYRGKVTHVQGTMKPMHSLDLGMKMDVLKKHGTVSVNFTDVFNTRKFSIISVGENFDSESSWKWQSRVLTVNFTYKLGDLNPDWNKKNRRRMDDSGGGGDDFDF